MSDDFLTDDTLPEDDILTGVDDVAAISSDDFLDELDVPPELLGELDDELPLEE